MTPDISLPASLDRCASLGDRVPGSDRTSGGRLVLSPSGPLVADAAEAFERQIQKLFREAQRPVIVDLHAVATIDAAGIQALVRAATSSLRMGGLLRLAAVRPAVALALERSDLSSAFEIYDSVAAARVASWPWRAIRVTTGGAVLCGVLVWAGLRWPLALAGLRDAAELLVPDSHVPVVQWFHPFIELLKLVAAALVGLLITAIHQPGARDRRSSMGQAQTLLCVSGAMMMIIIGNSLARAFGIAGAASIIRFRTPVDDPKDVTVLFLLMGLGMSIGLGAFAVAGLGAAFLCIALVVLGRASIDPLRIMSVDISAQGPQFPVSHVEAVFARHRIACEPREISSGENGVKNHKYHAWLDSRVSIEDLTTELMAEGLAGVAWAHAKRERA
jgi:anti-anti-sigma factor